MLHCSSWHSNNICNLERSRRIMAATVTQEGGEAGDGTAAGRHLFRVRLCDSDPLHSSSPEVHSHRTRMEEPDLERTETRGVSRIRRLIWIPTYL
jgi:hypothetical protein